MNYTPPDENNNGIPDQAEQKASGAKYDSLKEAHTVKTFWKDNPLGRTLTLRNKTGKLGATVLGGIGSTFFPEPFEGWIQKGIDSLITIQTGVPMEFLDLSFLQIGIIAAVALITWALPSLVPQIKEKAAWEIVESRIDDVTDEVVKAVDEDSEDGKNVTRSELKAIIGSVLKKEDLQR